MRRILGLPACLCASALILLLASGCNQGEGERCQVNSDCSNGLRCEGGGATGNGICTSGTPTEDAAAAGDAPQANGFEVEPQPDLAAAPAVDAVVSVDVTPIDGGAID
jgi:hypothetical protein